jgi:hypothetical protein
MSPNLNLLIECKKSAQSFVFFKNVSRKELPNNTPLVTGLGNDDIAIQFPEGTTTRSVNWLLDFSTTAYYREDVPLCSSFSKITFVGKKSSVDEERAELSGADIFKTVVYPLTKAVDYYASLTPAGNRREPLYPSLILPIAIIDAPMLVVSDPNCCANVSLEPWVRVMRQVALPKNPQGKRFNWYLIDVVHFGFLEEFATKHLMPFAHEFSNRICSAEAIIRHGGRCDREPPFLPENVRAATLS